MYANEIITSSLELSSELTEAYILCQDFLKAIRSLKYEDADGTSYSPSETINVPLTEKSNLSIANISC